jgi:hypothetical protein
MQPRGLTDSHPRSFDLRRGFELMKTGVADVCVTLSMTLISKAASSRRVELGEKLPEMHNNCG